jgi:HSP20 family protein
MAKDLERRTNASRPARKHRRTGEFISPWFENFLRPIDDWFDDFTSHPLDLGSTFLRPEMNIEENEKNYLISLDIPGVSKNDITIDSSDNHLTLSAVRNWNRQDDQRHETGQQTYRRTLTLPAEVEADQIEARYEDGVLMITVPKGEMLKSRRIKIGDRSEDKNTQLSGRTSGH